jgi:hypothetical protein
MAETGDWLRAQQLAVGSTPPPSQSNASACAPGDDQVVTRLRPRLIVGARFPAYLIGMTEGSAMPDTVAAPRVSRALLATVAGVAVLLAGTVVLWAHYGTAVFYEMILAGIAACF